MSQETLMSYAQECLNLAVENVYNNGGPFAAIIIHENKIIASGVNRVTQSNDPTAHAEVQAIRKACVALSNHQLNQCILITSCEPCPMCLGAIYWARLKEVYFIADQFDAAAVGFDDQFIYDELGKPYENRQIPFYRMDLIQKNSPFEAWKNNNHRIDY